ncbi:MAG TPA: ABC transporter substrate-binding protein [Ktedonobacteraceae bacterium]|nr:ABC transporter substrate-binding protein [Ktedonobacteraceae bacterium]
MTFGSLSSVFKPGPGRGGALLSLLVILALALAACGSGSSSSSSNTPTNTVLTISTGPTGAYTENFNPFNVASVDPGARGYIYETLLFFDSMNGSISPMLASSYQFSSDAKSITFHLRPNVKWSDGKPFSSADVVFTLNMLKQYPALDSNGLWDYISRVSAPDSSTVLVNLKQPYTPILWFLGGQTWIVPQHIWSTAGDPTRFTNDNPVGTGPYTLKSFSSQLIDLVKNPNYWQPGKPQVTELRFPAYNTNTTAELQLDQGNLDWTGLFTPNIQQTYVSRNPSTNHYWFPPGSVVMFYMNLSKSPFNNVAVRQAISLVINRQQLDNTAESGYEPPASPTGLVLPNQQKYLSPDYANTSFSVDVNKANQLLQSAGFTKNSSGIYVDKSGRPLNFNINVVTGWTDWVTDCQIIASSLKSIGMNATVNAISYNAYYSALQLGNFDTAISWTSSGPSPFFMFDALLASKYSAPIGQAAPTNWERWNDKTTDNLLNQYASSTDSNTQLQAMYGLEKIMVEQLPAIPLVYGATWNEYSTAKFTGWPSPSNPYASPAPFNYPDSEIVVLNLKAV